MGWDNSVGFNIGLRPETTSEDIYSACKDGDEYYCKEWAMNPDHDLNQRWVGVDEEGGVVVLIGREVCDVGDEWGLWVCAIMMSGCGWGETSSFGPVNSNSLGNQKKFIKPTSLAIVVTPKGTRQKAFLYLLGFISLHRMTPVLSAPGLWVYVLLRFAAPSVEQMRSLFWLFFT